ncbi:MAG TPA: cell envelope biogenesis protein OmpA, partial [Deltaproteobacteria bacterium]|nr:cell envelope biogenesis protein OmpA [Deltaproteobacteria bacterium]
MAQSYYKTIHGVRYDRSLLEAADERIAGQGDGRISEQDAKELVELSKDGGRVTETELRTLKH